MSVPANRRVDRHDRAGFDARVRLRGHGPISAAATAIRLATLPGGGPTGSFVNDDGAVPW
jgi:hypothetical protein